jgi:hypothetical protein
VNDWVHMVMIVTSQDHDLAKSLAVGLAGDAAAGMWETRLSATGSNPATHYISSGLIWNEFASILGNAQATFDKSGGQVPLATFEGLYARSILIGGNADPMQVLAEAGLKLINEEAQ